MAKRIDTSAYTSFSAITERLDQIVGEVRRKDLPLESSLDLFDEAIALGSKAVDFVDTEAPTSDELLQAEAAQNAEEDKGDAAVQDAGQPQDATADSQAHESQG